MDIINIQIQVDGHRDVHIPKMAKARQLFNAPELKSTRKFTDQLNKFLSQIDLEGKQIALTAGSRGIVRIVEITRIIVEVLKNYGALPFIVPAMGSHGGATANGQTEVIVDYGITPDNVGCPIRSSMDTVTIGCLEDGMPIYCDRIAFESDGIVVINKIKPHADFKGDHESGLLKMMVVGLGNHNGASAIHSRGFEQMATILLKAAGLILEAAPILFGVGILENPCKQLLDLELVPSNTIIQRDRELLILAKKYMPRLIMPKIDVLIVEEIGKNISGEGMDPNVTGRPGSGLLEGFEAPLIQKIVVLDITDESHGNGVGIGMADISTIRCYHKINLSSMYTNAITASVLDPAKIPILANSDQEAIQLAIRTCNQSNPNECRVVRIKNTMELQEIQVSEQVLRDMKDNPIFEQISLLEKMCFTPEGQLI
ncbi:MAG: hypothetical protein HQ569_05505 [Actinobacteria bacterium]|nr:hypothetical protein [Actinomycetota bacterium]